MILWFIFLKLPMTVRLTSLFLVGACRKSIRHLYIPVSVAMALSTVRWSTVSWSRCSCSLFTVWKYARSPNPIGEDHHLGGFGTFADVCLVSYLHGKIINILNIVNKKIWNEYTVIHKFKNIVYCKNNIINQFNRFFLS